MRILLTGMSGTGKSTLVAELRRRGHEAFDADDDGFSEPRGEGRWGWRADAVRELLDAHAGGLVVFAGCSEEQAEIAFDLRVVLTAPWPVLAERLATRTRDEYGGTQAELGQVRSDLREIEPLLLGSADLVLDATVPVPELADRVLRAAEGDHRYD